MLRRILPLLAFFAMLAVALPGASPARANGVPQLVKLTYLEGVSNFGPKNAEGVLEFSFAEAYARVDVKNLPPAEGSSLDGWLVAPDGAVFYVGTVVPNAEGIGRFDAKLSGLERYDYNLFVITSRDSGATLPAILPAQRTIAGRFTIIKDTTAGISGTGDVQPALLPDTGQAAAKDTPLIKRSTAAFAAMAAAGLAIVIVRTVKRRHVRD